MARFVQAADRDQVTLLPACLEDYVAQDNPTRVVDVFVDELDLTALGFAGVRPAATGRPGYHPATLLKLYLYGYLNQITSSRRLEREACRNVELMWLIGRLAPDFKTIADFRRENGDALRATCRHFVMLCRQIGLLAGGVVAVDGSRFKAVNTRDRNFTPAAVRRRIEQVETSIVRYLAALDTADRQEAEVTQLRTPRLKERLFALRDRLRALQAMETLVEAAPDRQISLTDPDARAMATNGKGTGLVGYNVQAAVDTKHHLVVAHEVTNVGHDRTQLANIAGQAQSAIDQETIQVLADRGYFSGEEILACDRAGIAVTLPKPMTSGAKAEGRFGKQDFVYQASDDTYRCPGDQTLTYRFEGVENGMTLRRYWTSACPACPIKNFCTPAEQRRVTRWEHEHVLEAVQRRLDENPNAMRDRRQTVEHVFGTLKAWMGATHFLTRGLKNVASEMSLQVLAYNMKRVIAILGAGPLIAAIQG